jgi:hypothetical protein
MPIQSFRLNRLVILAPIIASSMLLTACGGSNNPVATQTQATPAVSDLTEIVVDATAGGIGAVATNPANKHTYFNLDTGLVVGLTDTAAETSVDWHMGFKRTGIILNGGDSGSSNVTGAVADKQDDFYDTGTTTPNPSVFLNATPAIQLADIAAVDESTGLTFSADENVNQITSDGGSESWWLYNPAARTISANLPVWNVIRSANGDSFAKFNVTNIVQVSRDITLELFIQGVSDSAFSLTSVTWTASIGAGGGTKCYDIDTTAEVDCTEKASDWDVQVEVSADGRSWTLWTNGGVRGTARSGASFGTLTETQADQFVASSTPGLIFSADAPSGVFKESTWYEYNLQGDRKLWPNYRVYIVDTGTNKYKLQITSYYGASGTSAMINLRYAKL